jgi:hypothetical protein
MDGVNFWNVPSASVTTSAASTTSQVTSASAYGRYFQTSDQLRQALMLSTTARSKPWYRTVLRLSGGGFADRYGGEVAGI